MSGASFWDDLSELTQSASPEGRWLAPEVVPSFTFLERIREVLPEEEESPEATAALTKWHTHHRGSGFGGVWRGPDGDLLSPPWLALHPLAADRATGNVVAAGHLDYQYWGIEVDAPKWTLVNGLYIGSVATGSFIPFDLGISVSSVDLNPATGEIAVLHHLGISTFAVSIVTPSGARRLLTVLEDLGGYEIIRYSPNGQWLLVSRSADTYIVEVATGRWLALGIANTGWDPSADSSVLTIVHEDGNATPRVFSLELNSYVRDLPPIELDVPLLESFPHIWSPEVSRDGNEVLARTPAGVTVEFQKENGVGSHLAKFELDTSRGSLVNPVFANEECTLERDVIESSWGAHSDSSWSLSLHPDLEQRLNGPVTAASDPSWTSETRWASEAEVVLVSVLNRAINLLRENASASHLMPEVIAALSSIANTPVWDRQYEWLSNLRDITMSMVSSGEMDGALAGQWMKFALAIRTIEQGQSDELHKIQVRR